MLRAILISSLLATVCAGTEDTGQEDLIGGMTSGSIGPSYDDHDKESLLKSQEGLIGGMNSGSIGPSFASSSVKK